MVSKTEKLALGMSAIVGLALISLWYFLSPKENGGNGNGPPPPPETCDVLHTPGTVGWCRCVADEQGWNSYALGELKYTELIMLSLIPQFPTFPRNPEQYIIIRAYDKCGQLLPETDIWLSQSTTEWGGFVIPGTKNVNCAKSGEILIGKTGSDGKLKIRYLCHHNPGKGVAESVEVYIRGVKEDSINGKCIVTINGTDGAWPFDPYMITQEYAGGSPWTWYECGL